MGLFRSIGRIASSAFRGIKSVASGGIGNLLKTGLGALTGGGGGLGGLLGGLGEKFGLGKIMSKVTGFLGKLGPLASMAGGPLGMIGGLLGQLGQKGGFLGKIAEFATGLLGKLGGAQNIPAPGLNNLTEMFAKTHAQNLLANFFR